MARHKRQPYLRLWVKPSQLDYQAIKWYEQANLIFRQGFGRDADLFIDILAATSPRLQLRANFRLKEFEIWDVQ